MTFALSWPLQKAVYASLRADPEIAALVGDRVFDEPPQRDPGCDQGPLILIGDDAAEAWGAGADEGAAHVLDVAVVSSARGFAEAKRIAGAICDALRDPLPLERGRVVSTTFMTGRTARPQGGGVRRIDLRFRVVLEDDAPQQGGR